MYRALIGRCYLEKEAAAVIEVDVRLKQLYWDCQNVTELEAKILELWEMKQMLRELLTQYAEETKQEQKDVQSLESPSFKGLLLGLTGRKEEILKKERRDVMEARIQQEITAAELAKVANDLENVLDQQRKLGNCQEEFWFQFPTVYAEYRNSGAGDQATAQDLEFQMVAAAKHHKEVEEALLCGRDARRSIDLALKSLNEVRASEEDALATGSGLVRGKIAQAQTQVNQMRDTLSVFKEELLDLHLPAEMRFDLHGFLQLEDDCLTSRASTNITEQHRRITMLLHPAILQIDAIIPWLESMQGKSHLRLQQARLSLAQHVLEELDEI